MERSSGEWKSTEESQSHCDLAAAVLIRRRSGGARAGQGGRCQDTEGHLPRARLARQYAIAPRALGGQRRPLSHGHDRPGRHRRCCCEGSTTTQGKYAKNIRLAVDYLLSRSRANGLIGDPTRDDRYTYGHGFSMLFLSQVLGEEEDEDRRKELIDVLTKAVRVHRPGPDRGRRLGLCQRQGRQRFRRRLDHDHAGARAARLPQRRHSGAQGNHRQGRQIHPQMHAARRRRTVQFQGRRRPAGHLAPRPSPACSTPATTTDEYVPKLLDYCETKPRRTSPTRASATGTTPTTTTPRCMYREGGKKWEAYRDKIYHQAGRRSHRRRQVRLLEPRLHRPDLHHRHQPDDPATGKRHAADLSALNVSRESRRAPRSRRGHANATRHDLDSPSPEERTHDDRRLRTA